ncbi:MmgE/PrpD family protein [Mangrovicoccus sp. HB161399]|uniref:MmgE/PrpD family protein n=1 Tax=Mangrovicoccus sp. HB161399 TaxID=2720392 RepID=UPI001553C8A4|nr:MmgE/PrpD family protein [Mangrovicoccus sp. HB161399]
MDGAAPTRPLACFAAGGIAAPKEIRDHLALHLLDTLACAAGGAGLEISRAARRHAVAMGGSGPAGLIGGGATSPMMAAFANALAANALDFDDGFEHEGKGMGHPGATMVAAALAAAAKRPVPGPEFLDALIAATEVNNRLILSLQPTPERFREVYGIGQHQAIGAAMAYGRLCGLDAAAMENAIGLAATLVPVPSLHKYNWTARPIASFKDFVAPAAQAGVQAVELSLAGFTGAAGVLDGPQGFWRMAGSDRFDAGLLTGGLGERWLSGQGAFKTYPACRWIAPALEAAETVLAGIAPEEIRALTIRSFADVAAKMGVCDPVNAIDAQFALPHLIACLAHGLPVGPRWMDAEALADPQLRATARKVVLETDPEADAAMTGRGRRPSATAELLTADGRWLSHHIPAPKGGALRPVSGAAVLAKASGLLAAAGLPEGVLVTLEGLAQAEDVAAACAPLFAGFG